MVDGTNNKYKRLKLYNKYKRSQLFDEYNYLTSIKDHNDVWDIDNEKGLADSIGRLKNWRSPLIFW